MTLRIFINIIHEGICIMKVSQAGKCFIDYHRLNSKKKYARKL